MGGQACVLYGAAEFTKDVDLAVSPKVEDLPPVVDALALLGAKRIAVPEFKAQHLEAGHAIHFRATDPEIGGLRIDLMSRMRGAPEFEQLWNNRSEVQLEDGSIIALVGIADLVTTKKTQRDKDWPMISRLVAANYISESASADPRKSRFWLRELRSPELLIEASSIFPALAKELLAERPLLSLAINENLEALSAALREEENVERKLDREYWLPLKKELETLRHLERNLER